MKSNSTLRDYRVVVVARNLDDPVKNVRFAVETFREAFHDKAHAHLTLIGEGGKDGRGSLELPHHRLSLDPPEYEPGGVMRCQSSVSYEAHAFLTHHQ